MEQIPAAKWERTMKVQEVILRAMAEKITWWQTAESKTCAADEFRHHPDGPSPSR
jgi:hypothetical protein